MKLEIIGWESQITPPDADGDRGVIGRVTVACSGEGTIGLVRTSHVVTDAAGLPVLFGATEDDDILDDGDVAQLEVREWAPGHLAPVRGQLFVEGCTAERHALATCGAPTVGGVVGSASVARLAGDLEVTGWSARAVLDDDGDARLSLLVVLRNAGTTWWRRVRVRLELRGPDGQDLDTSEAETDGLAPGATASVDAMAFLKPRWLEKGATLQVTVIGHRVLGRASAPPMDLELVPD